MSGMKKAAIAILLVISPITMILPAFGQKKIQVSSFGKFRIETQLTYNFFTGPDAADFGTSIKGFGSGIVDALAMRSSADIINIGTDKFYLSFGAGFAVIKYRLADHLVFGKSSDGQVTWNVDPDPSHNYVNSFFGYGKSKIITTSFYFPLNLNIELGKNVSLTAGGYADLNLTARYKMKYLVGEDKVKEIIRSADFRTFNPSIMKIGLNASVFHKKLAYGLSASYSLTPFFKPGMGPDIHETRITATYSLKDLTEVLRKKKK